MRLAQAAEGAGAAGLHAKSVALRRNEANPDADRKQHGAEQTERRGIPGHDQDGRKAENRDESSHADH